MTPRSTFSRSRQPMSRGRTAIGCLERICNILHDPDSFSRVSRSRVTLALSLNFQGKKSCGKAKVKKEGRVHSPLPSFQDQPVTKYPASFFWSTRPRVFPAFRCFSRFRVQYSRCSSTRFSLRPVSFAIAAGVFGVAVRQLSIIAGTPRAPLKINIFPKRFFTSGWKLGTTTSSAAFDPRTPITIVFVAISQTP